jgi:hypothetical protein
VASTGKPIYEQKEVKAKYRVAEVGVEKVLLKPFQRVHLIEECATTELPDITVNLNDKIKQSMGEMKVGDLKEFSLTITVLTGYDKPAV